MSDRKIFLVVQASVDAEDALFCSFACPSLGPMSGERFCHAFRRELEDRPFAVPTSAPMRCHPCLSAEQDEEKAK